MHVLADISAHGLGHLAQTAPVLSALRERFPAVRLTVRSGLAVERLAQRIRGPFTHIAAASDFGFVMQNAVDIDFAASARRYQAFHTEWDANVAEAAAALRRDAVDVVLANAAYLPLAAAAQAGIPAVGFCSLNWADLFAHYFGGETWAVPVVRQMYAAYNAADIFLRLQPGMPMPHFARTQSIGPIAALASAAPAILRERIAARQGWDTRRRWVLLAMGGMDFPLPVADWPQDTRTLWLCPAAWGIERPDAAAFDPAVAEHGFTDLLAASDAVVTKPGYGTFVEAACNGVPVLYVPREDWPEEMPLAEWLNCHGRACAVSRPTLLAGDFLGELEGLLARPAPPVPPPAGIAQAVEAIAALVAGR